MVVFAVRWLLLSLKVWLVPELLVRSPTSMQPILFKCSLCGLLIGCELPTLWLCILLSLKVILVFYHKCGHARGRVLYLFYVPLLMVTSHDLLYFSKVMCVSL